MAKEFAVFSNEIGSTELIFFFWTDKDGVEFWKGTGYVVIHVTEISHANLAGIQAK